MGNDKLQQKGRKRKQEKREKEKKKKKRPHPNGHAKNVKKCKKKQNQKNKNKSAQKDTRGADGPGRRQQRQQGRRRLGAPGGGGGGAREGAHPRGGAARGAARGAKGATMTECPRDTLHSKVWAQCAIMHTALPLQAELTKLPLSGKGQAVTVRWSRNTALKSRRHWRRRPEHISFAHLELQRMCARR